MFVDEVKVLLEAGSGGNGCMAFRREKCVPMGGPFGGNGGKGADIVFKVDEGLNTLIDLRYQKVIKADKGENGSGKGKHGANAEDLIIRVPVGTIVYDDEKNLIIADLVKKEDEVIAVYGGRGGRGNIALATFSNPAPSYSENGEPGELKKIRLELKLLADVGLVGMPSVGKSTIINKISAAKAKVGAYHFTTLSPNLGVVKVGDKSFTVADLPGLIEGASKGEGLGEEFLRHVERTKIIAHVIDMGATEGRDPYNDYVVINNELKLYNESLLLKPQIIIANKMDMPDFEKELKSFKEKVGDIQIFSVSAVTGEGLNKVIEYLVKELEIIKNKPIIEDSKGHVLYEFKEEIPFTIRNEKGVWVITGNKVEKLFRMTRFNTDEAANRFSNQLRKMGIDEELRRLGANDGDTVRILDYEFEYKL